MAIPEGYQFLAKLGIVYKGDYDENVTYNQYDAVYYNGSTYIALVDSPAGPPTADGVNWQYMAQGFLSQVISSLTATDKNGVIGEAGATVNAQELINGISDDLKDKLDKTGDASDTIVTFEQASERTNIISGESHKTIFGKIKKWFADMTAAAFAQIITSNTDLMATTVAGYLVDAHAVKQQFDVVNSNLIKAYPITKTVTVQPYSYAMGGYNATVNISDFDDYDDDIKRRAVAIIPTCCYFSSNASVVGSVSLLADGNRISINASNEGNYLVGLIILYK